MKLLLASTLIVLAFAPVLAIGAEVEPKIGGRPVTVGNAFGDDPNNLLKRIETVTDWIFAIFITVAIIFILFAAFTYLTSGGGEEVQKAHKQLLYAAVAIAVAVLSKGIIVVVRKIVETPVSGQ